MPLPPDFALSPEERAALLRMDLSTFTARCFAQLNPQTPYLPNWHIDLIAARLEACRQGKIRRLIINIPPRNLKSIAASVALPAFWLGHQPSAQILCASYAQDLADKLSLDCRRVMESPWYKALFPKTRISPLRAAKAEFTTTANGFRMATSVGGVLTGRGADVVIIDDPLKPEEAVSETQRKAANEWFDSTLYSRLNDKGAGVIILIMQRLHLDDLVGHVRERGEPWEPLSLPAIAEQEERHIYDSFGQPVVHVRAPGEALHPEREPLEVLAAVRKALGEYHFSAQYLQAPVPLGGGMVKDA